MFYTVFMELCLDKGVKPGRAADEMGINRSTVTSWKKSGYTPRADQLQKLAEYFKVPTDLLLESPPFDCWDLINENRGDFLKYADINPVSLKLLFGIDPENPDDAPVSLFAAFISSAILSVLPLAEGGFQVEVSPAFKQKQTPALTKKDERDIARDIEAFLDDMENNETLMFDGDPISGEARESIIAAMKLGLSAAKAKNKERFTPKKFRRG